MNEREQRNVSRPLDRRRQHTLMVRAVACDASRHNLTPLGQEITQHTVVFEIDIFYALDAKTANLTPRKTAAAHRTTLSPRSALTAGRS